MCGLTLLCSLRRPPATETQRRLGKYLSLDLVTNVLVLNTNSSEGYLSQHLSLPTE